MRSGGFGRVGARMAIAASVIAVVTLVVVAIVESWSPGAWTAIAAWTTAGLAPAAGLIALGQLGEARRLRAEQAQPYVVVSMELSRPHSKAIDLVVKNLGKTAALEVRVEVEPVPIRAAGNQREVWLPEQVPVLVPEQEWRTFWDLTTAREAPELRGRHTAVVTYKDTHGGDFKFEYVLDWAPALNRGSLVVYDTHDSAKALREINETFKRLRRFLEGRERARRAEREARWWSRVRAGARQRRG